MYALIALGYTMVYGVLEFINFAHSEIFVVGAFVGVEILSRRSRPGGSSGCPGRCVLVASWWPARWSAALLAVTIERVAYRPLRARRPPDPADLGDRRVVLPAGRRARSSSRSGATPSTWSIRRWTC
mgnify:CR=1 FL=1